MKRKKLKEEAKDLNENKPFRCPIKGCNFAAKRAGTLNLHKYQVHGVGKKAEDAGRITEVLGKEGMYSIASSKQFKLSAPTIALMQLLIQTGKASNMEELMEKSIYNLAYGGGKMSDNSGEGKNKASEILKQVEDVETTKAVLDAWRGKRSDGEEKAPSEDEIDRAIKDMTKQLRWKQTQKMMSGDDFSMKDMMQMEMLQSMMRRNRGSDSQNLSVLQQQINSLQQQMQQRELQHRQELEMQNLRNSISKIGEKKGMNAEDIMKIWADRDSAVKTKDIELQKERDKGLRTMLDSKLRELERATPSGGDTESIKKIAEAIKALREVNKELGSGREEGERGKIAQEFIKSTIDQLKDPLIRPIGESIARGMEQRIAQPPMPMPMEQLPPEALSNIESPSANTVPAVKKSERYSIPVEHM